MTHASFTLRRARGLMTALVFSSAGCAAVRPVHVTPPSAPPAFVSEFHDGARPPRGAPGSKGPARAGGRMSALQASPDGGSPDDERDEDDDAPAAAPTSPGGPAQDGVWWAAFADPALDSAIQEALRNNYLMRDVRTLIHEDQLDPTTPRGPLWPLQIGVPSSVQRITLPGPALQGSSAYSNSYTQADVGLAASYQVDVWGQLDARRRVADDLVEQQRQSTEVNAQNVAEQVAQLWFEILELRALRNLLDDQVRYGRDLLGIVKARFEQHLATRLAVLQQEQQLLGTQAQLPLVLAQLALQNSKLTALLGRVPALNADLVPPDRSLPDLPPPPAVGAPADLLAKSPELRFAHARVVEPEHSLNRNLAGWLPTIELVGSVGARSYDFTDTFLQSAVGVRLTWPLFDGGQRITEAKQLELTIQRRKWQYELAMNSAVQRVQEALIQEKKQAESFRTLRAQVELGRRVLQEARQLFEQGLSDYLPVITALTNVTTLERASIQANRLLLSYRIQLYHALGGTWSKAATKITN